MTAKDLNGSDGFFVEFMPPEIVLLSEGAFDWSEEYMGVSFGSLEETTSNLNSDCPVSFLWINSATFKKNLNLLSILLLAFSSRSTACIENEQIGNLAR